MHIKPIDPRGAEWEADDPEYRVVFWSKSEEADGNTVWSTEEFEITGTGLDVADILSWAHEHSKESALVVIYIVAYGDGGRPGLVRLSGHEPDVYAQRLSIQAEPKGDSGRDL